MLKKDKVNYIIKNIKNNNTIIVYIPENLENWLNKQSDDFINSLYELI